MGAVLADALKVPDWQQNPNHSKRAARILRSRGWTQTRSKGKGEPYERDVRYWYR